MDRKLPPAQVSSPPTAVAIADAYATTKLVAPETLDALWNVGRIRIFAFRVSGNCHAEITTTHWWDCQREFESLWQSAVQLTTHGPESELVLRVSPQNGNSRRNPRSFGGVCRKFLRLVGRHWKIFAGCIGRRTKQPGFTMFSSVCTRARRTRRRSQPTSLASASILGKTLSDRTNWRRRRTIASHRGDCAVTYAFSRRGLAETATPDHTRVAARPVEGYAHGPFTLRCCLPRRTTVKQPKTHCRR